MFGALFSCGHWEPIKEYGRRVIYADWWFGKMTLMAKGQPEVGRLHRGLL